MNGLDSDMLRRLAAELLRRQPAVFADLINGEMAVYQELEILQPDLEAAAPHPDPQACLAPHVVLTLKKHQHLIRNQQNHNKLEPYQTGAIVACVQQCPHKQKTNVVVLPRCSALQQQFCSSNLFLMEMYLT